MDLSSSSLNATAVTQVLTGSVVARSKGASGCPVRPWTPDQADTREAKFDITFEEAFESPPVVTAFFTYFDVFRNAGANMRLRLEVSDVTATGFTLVVGTWCDSAFYKVDATWQAIG